MARWRQRQRAHAVSAQTRLIALRQFAGQPWPFPALWSRSSLWLTWRRRLQTRTKANTGPRRNGGEGDRSVERGWEKASGSHTRTRCDVQCFVYSSEDNRIHSYTLTLLPSSPEMQMQGRYANSVKQGLWSDQEYKVRLALMLSENSLYHPLCIHLWYKYCV